MRRSSPLSVLLSLVAVLCFAARAYGSAPGQGDAVGLSGPDLVKVSGTAEGDVSRAGSKVAVKVDLRIEKGWHVNAHKLDDEFLIPTNVDLKPPEGMTIGEPIYPEGELATFAFAPDQKLKVYQGTITVTATGTIGKPQDAAAKIAGKLRYQACNDKQCLPPRNVSFEIPVKAAPATVPSSGEDEGSGSGKPKPTGRASAEPPGGIGADGSAWARVRGVATGSSGVALASLPLPLLLLAAFIGGLLLDLTPCVYPMIPVTIGIFGSQSAGSLRRSFGLASFYVLGMAITYSALGTLASLTGRMFGQWLQSPWLLGTVALALVGLALSSFGLYEIRLPGALTSHAGTREGFAGALLKGLLMGVVAAPCIGPFVISLVTYVAAVGDPVRGFLLFFVLSLGLGTPFLFLAAFASSLKVLPRSGAWMHGVRRIFGLVLLGMALYFVAPLLPESAFAISWRVYALGAVVYLLGFEPIGHAPGSLGRAFKAAFAASAFVLFWVAGGFGARQAEGIAFAPWSPEAAQAAREAGRPLLIDFTADWCVPCRELESSTFVDRKVAEKARAFATLQVDITEAPSPEVKDLMERFGVIGPPTVLFLCPDGTEHGDLRVVGYVDASRFARALEAASSRACPRTVARGL